jgi:hypothetical protein
MKRGCLASLFTWCGGIPPDFALSGSGSGWGWAGRPCFDPSRGSPRLLLVKWIVCRLGVTWKTTHQVGSNDNHRLDEGVVWGFPWLWTTGWRFCRKTQKEQAKCMYCVRLLCTVYSFPPTAAETCARLAGNFCQYLTTVKSGANGMVWLNVWYFTTS